MFTFDGRVVLITGAGSEKGIGRATALEFAKAGADLAIADLDFAGAQNTCALIEELGRKALPIHLDVTDPEACEKAVQEVVDTFGKLDVLVNNAGISQKVTIADMTIQDVERIFKVNFYGMFNITKPAAAAMKERGYGRIVNLSSVSAKRGGGIFGGEHYSAAKAGDLGFAKNFSREYAMHGITNNSVCPGLINTDIWKTLPKEQADKIIENIPVGRPGEIKEVAAAILFLASEEASYITGEEIDINGGMHMD
jgi:3-oxoacyl-[acyl-carrier protein] reductase